MARAEEGEQRRQRAIKKGPRDDRVPRLFDGCEFPPTLHPPPAPVAFPPGNGNGNLGGGVAGLAAAHRDVVVGHVDDERAIMTSSVEEIAEPEHVALE